MCHYVQKYEAESIFRETEEHAEKIKKKREDALLGEKGERESILREDTSCRVSKNCLGLSPKGISSPSSAEILISIANVKQRKQHIILSIISIVITYNFTGRETIKRRLARC